MNKEINYDLINDLYMSWYNDRDPFTQRDKKEDIKRKISPYELLIYSARYSSPFKAFRNVFSLAELFKTLEQMQKQGEDIRKFTNQSLSIDSMEDIRSVSDFAKRESPSEINNFELLFTGSSIFEYGDFKSIGKKFPYTKSDGLSIEQLEQIMKSQRDYKGLPITITIDNIGQLPLGKLNEIEKFFDVEGVKVASKDNLDRGHQGERTPLNLRTYKQIRGLVDNEIISKLYVGDIADKTMVDYQLAIQVIDMLANKMEYDYEATKAPIFSNEVRNASGLVGLLTGKTMCKGDSEILRNVLSCVGIECVAIEGTALGDENHAWNQVKLGDSWLNVDLTFARSRIREGTPSGDLFMSDVAFFGDRRKVTSDKGQVYKGKDMETTVTVGGHTNVRSSNHKQCGRYFPPFITSTLIQKSRLYDENYRSGKSLDGKRVVPYIGSSIHKMRSNSEVVAEIEYE